MNSSLSPRFTAGRAKHAKARSLEFIYVRKAKEKKKNTRTNLNSPLFLTIPLNWKTLHSNAATYTVNLPNVITKFLH